MWPSAVVRSRGKAHVRPGKDRRAALAGGARRAGCSLASRTRHADSGAPGVTSVRRRNGAGAGALTRLSKGRAETLTTRLIPIPGARVKPGRAPASLMPAAFERGSRQGIETPQDWREQEVGSRQG